MTIPIDELEERGWTVRGEKDRKGNAALRYEHRDGHLVRRDYYGDRLGYRATNARKAWDLTWFSDLRDALRYAEEG